MLLIAMALLCAVKACPEISVNKVMASSWSVLAPGRSAERLFLALSVLLPRWKDDGLDLGASSYNKRSPLRCSALNAPIFLLAGRGGKGEEGGGSVAAAWRRWVRVSVGSLL